jgi:hypothetical protein
LKHSFSLVVLGELSKEGSDERNIQERYAFKMAFTSAGFALTPTPTGRVSAGNTAQLIREQLKSRNSV